MTAASSAGAARSDHQLVRETRPVGRKQHRFVVDRDQALAPAHLLLDDVAETVLWVATRPPHVCIDEIIIKPTDQASGTMVHRRD